MPDTIMIEIKECMIEDVSLLAEMNKQLIEDEKADNSMDIIQLKNRMVDFLNNGYKRNRSSPPLPFQCRLFPKQRSFRFEMSIFL